MQPLRESGSQKVSNAAKTKIEYKGHYEATADHKLQFAALDERVCEEIRNKTDKEGEQKDLGLVASKSVEVKRLSLRL